MNLSRYREMDPQMLLGLINTALRNDGEELTGLVLTHDLDEEALRERLQEIGYRYIGELRQFRPVTAVE
jgi:hypothetical protein